MAWILSILYNGASQCGRATAETKVFVHINYSEECCAPGVTAHWLEFYSRECYFSLFNVLGVLLSFFVLGLRSVSVHF